MTINTTKWFMALFLTGISIFVFGPLLGFLFINIATFGTILPYTFVLLIIFLFPIYWGFAAGISLIASLAVLSVCINLVGGVKNAPAFSWRDFLTLRYSFLRP